ncbi:MAG: PorT family protein [Rikenellaceae bacterium]|jgi:hypothetical protein|nr:PorT family protein [Rikenellaceae bacterium]
MKRIPTILIFALALLGGGEACAQHYTGVRAGFGGGTARLYPNADMRYLWGMPNFGLSWKYYSEERVVGAVEADLEYMQRGFKRIGQDNPNDPGDTTTYRRTVSSFMLPFSWHPHVYLFNRSMRVFINAGITLSYNFSSRESLHHQDGTLAYDRLRPFQTNRDNSWGYGLMGGFGVSYLTGRYEFFAEARYYFGYSDVLKNRDVYPANPLRSPVDNVNLSLGLFYRIDPREILSRPSAPRIKIKDNTPQHFESTGGGRRR